VRRLILRRALVAIPVLWLVVTAAFFAVHAAPGSVEDLVADPTLSPAARQAIRAHWGLDRPLHEQYLRWLGAVATGDLGVSFLYHQPVAAVVGRALGPTALLTGTALAIDLLLGLGVAVLSVRRPHGAVDRLLGGLSLLLYGMPPFWLALMAVLVFSLRLGWLPPSHMASVGAAAMAPAARALDLLRHLVLPAGVLALAGFAATARYLRAALLDVATARHLLAARARGIPPRRLFLVHALRPALLPVATLLGLAVPALVSGALVVEVVFSWPGMGRVMWTAATARDIPVVLATTLLAAGAVLGGTLMADLAYAALDPRVRRSV